MKIDVLMTVYNDGDRFLKRSIQSILDQSYKNFKLIIVNDGSTDSTDEIVSEFMNLDKRITYINRKDNKGRVYSLNEGLNYCDGDFIFINDADDISMVNRIEECVNFYNNLDYRKKKFGLLGTAYISSDLKNNDKTVYKLKSWNFFKREIPMWRLLISMPFPHSSVMYKKSALINVGGFSKEVTAGIDYLTLLKIANEFKVYGIDKILVERIIDGNNFFMQKNINSLSKNNTEIINTWQKKNVRYLLINKIPYYTYILATKIRKYVRKLIGGE